MSWSSNATILTRETSDSNSSVEPSWGTLTNKCQRFKHEVLLGYKGIIQQQNSNFGPQIYFNNMQIWLGTFKSEMAAGMAYGFAALKLRDGYFDCNFPSTILTLHEPNFQRRFTNEAVVNMIRDSSCPFILSNYIKTHGRTEQNYIVAHQDMQQPRRVSREQLFQKELTLSDTGKLNRLVIPKRAALKFFPPVPVGGRGRRVEEVELTFQDGSMRIWKFRYCYWQSSRSYVFTRGWKRFVSVNNLRSRDVLTFSRCRLPGNTNDASLIHVIEVTHRNLEENGNAIASAVVECSNDVNEQEVEGGVAVHPIELMDSLGVEGSNGNSLKREFDMGGEEDGPVEKRKGFRLFGVQIV